MCCLDHACECFTLIFDVAFLHLFLLLLFILSHVWPVGLHGGLNRAPIYRVYTTYVCFPESVNCTVPQNLVHSSHLLGDFDRSENEIPDLRVFCKNDKVSTCSIILIEPRMRFLSLEFFVRTIRFPPAR